MKILIAYDGSDSADTAIDGLQRAGLPTENVEALVVSVGEVWLPPPVIFTGSTGLAIDSSG